MSVPNSIRVLVILAPLLCAQENNSCMDCHQGNAQSQRGGIEIDPQRFQAATHSAIGCTGCHMEGFAEFPHKGKKADAPDCTLCHSGDASPPYNRALIEQDMKQSIHVQLVDPQFACTNCHYPHYFRPVRKMGSIAEAVTTGNRVCMECHAKADASTGTDEKNAWQQLAAKHTWIPMWEMHTKAARCVDCHTPGKEDTIHRILPAAQAQRDCVSCHSRDSILLHKLYKHVAKEERDKNGILNAVIFNNAYMIGATKSAWMEQGSLILFAAALAGIGIHAALRWAASRRRKSI
jgi:hypothetical protein